MEYLIRSILYNSQVEQHKVIICTAAGRFSGIISKVDDHSIEMLQENGKRCWVVQEMIQAIQEE